MSEIEEERIALNEMIAWVNGHASDPEIALVLGALGDRGVTLEQLADENREEAWQICDALFNMVEDTFTDEQLHSYLRKNQPQRRYDENLKLGGL